MQRGKYIGGLMKFIYVMIYFLSLFHVATSANLDCRNDGDCIHIKCKSGWVAKCTATHWCNCIPPSGSAHPWRTRPKRVQKQIIGENDLWH
ncbi:unnamed protein product [Trifolium pratense]|uniref:Uncharacterized protein n=1 Tax=Trifolium pratense TaxID=57577 RepID=A0ACB0IXK2_TRIPR|nr:unnamed protein product [Trifolium pratense]